MEAETDMKFLLKGLECVSMVHVSLVLPASCLWTLLLAVLASAGPEDSWRLVPTLVPDQSRGGWSWTPPRAREPEVRMLLDVDILEEVARGDTLSLHLSSMLDMSRTTETECTLCCWSPDTFPESSHTTFHGVAPQHYTLLPPALVVLGQMCGQTIAACCTIAAQRAQHSHQAPSTPTKHQRFGPNPNCANPFNVVVPQPGPAHSTLTPIYSAVLYNSYHVTKSRHTMESSPSNTCQD